MNATEMVAMHGRKALQVIIDRIVAAVKDGDDALVKELDLVLRQVERELEHGARVTTVNRLNVSGDQRGPVIGIIPK